MDDAQSLSKPKDKPQEKANIQVPSHLTGHSRFWCEICSVGMTDDSAYLQHVRGRKHLRVVSQLKRPFKCYVCHINFNVEPEFNKHLEGKAHMDKAFKKRQSEKHDGKDDAIYPELKDDSQRKVEIFKESCC